MASTRSSRRALTQPVTTSRRTQNPKPLRVPLVAWANRLNKDDGDGRDTQLRSEEHTSELQSQSNLVCRLLLEKKKKEQPTQHTKQTRTTHMPPSTRHTPQRTQPAMVGTGLARGSQIVTYFPTSIS